MSSRAAEFEAAFGAPNAKIVEAPNKAKIGKSIREMDKLLGSQGKGSWPDSSVSTLERSLGEISRSLDKNEAKDKHAFFALKGFQTLARLFGLMADQKQSCVIPQKSIMSTSVTWKLACGAHRQNTEFVLKSNYLTLIVDILMDRLSLLIPEDQKYEADDFVENDNGPIVDPVAKSIMNLMATLLSDLTVFLKDEKKMDTSQVNDVKVRAQDQVSTPQYLRKILARKFIFFITGQLHCGNWYCRQIICILSFSTRPHRQQTGCGGIFTVKFQILIFYDNIS